MKEKDDSMIVLNEKVNELIQKQSQYMEENIKNTEMKDQMIAQLHEQCDLKDNKILSMTQYITTITNELEVYRIERNDQQRMKAEYLAVSDKLQTQDTKEQLRDELMNQTTNYILELKNTIEKMFEEKKVIRQYLKQTNQEKENYMHQCDLLTQEIVFLSNSKNHQLGNNERHNLLLE